MDSEKNSDRKTMVVTTVAIMSDNRKAIPFGVRFFIGY